MNDKGAPHTQPREAGSNSAQFETLREALEAARNKLLDRSLRNKLIHTNIESARGRHIRIFDAQSSQVFRHLAEGKTITFIAAAKSTDDGEESREHSIYVPPNGDTTFSQDEEVDTAKGPQRGLRLRTRLTPEGLQKKLLSLFYEGQTLEEEQGINILYLALGFLEWREARQSDIPRFAPLVLLPVELIRDGAKDRFKLKLRPEDLLTNFSLQAWLKEQFGLEYPDLPDDELDIKIYFSNIFSLIKNQKNWKIHEDEIVLGFFSFSKFLLWRDLDPKNWPRAEQLAAHPLLTQILLRDRSADARESEDVPIIGEGERLDDVFRPSDLVHITDADSSQAIAIQEALSGKNLVIQGPPGTGKSQTITNLIAGAVKRGKRVLFIAEKMAALDVVHSRLVKAHLGAICLELHSRKAAKTQVLEQIKSGMTAPPPPAWSVKAFSDLESLQGELRAHSDRLHEPGPNARTPFELIGAMTLIKRRRTPTPDFHLPVAEKWTAELADRYAKRVKEFADRLAVAGVPATHPWRGASIETPSLLDQDRLRPYPDAFATSAAKMKRIADRVEALLRIEAGRPARELRHCCSALDHLAFRPPGLDPWLASEPISDSTKAIGILIADGERLAGLHPVVEPYERLFDYLSPEEPPAGLIEAWSLLTARPADLDEWLASDSLLVQLGDVASLVNFGERFADLRPRVNAYRQLFDYLSPGTPASDLAKVWDHLANRPKNVDKILADPDVAAHRVELAQLLSASRRRYELRDALETEVIPEALELDWLETRKVIANQGKSPFRWLSSSYRSNVAKLRGVCRRDLPKTHVDRLVFLDRLGEERRNSDQVQSLQHLSGFWGSQWRGFDTDWDHLRCALEWVETATTFEPQFQLRSELAFELSDGAGVWPTDTQDRSKLVSALAECRDLEQWISSLPHARDILGELWAGEQSNWATLRSLLEWIERAQAFEPRIKLREKEAFDLSDKSGFWPASREEQEGLISQLCEARSLQARIAQRVKEQEYLGELWLGAQTDWHRVRAMLSWVEGARAFEPAIKLRSRDVLESAAAAAELSSALKAFLLEAKTTLTSVQQHFGLDENLALPGGAFDDLSAGYLDGVGTLWRAQLTRVTEWPAIREDLRWLEAIGCLPLAERIYDGRIGAAHLTNTFLLTVYEAMWTRTKRNVPELEQMLGDQLSNYVSRFRKADRDRIDIAADEVRRAHIDQRPAGKAGEVGVLVDETKKARKLKPVRKLVEEAGNAIQRFKPVLLMSPLSVAQYLPPGKLEFDLCIIDEASQVRPEDALGAIARCKQVVVVGDDKQLPPTSFFSRMVGDDDDLDDDEQTTSDAGGVRAAAVKDVESILNLCSRFPDRMLRWHYRSEHPSLIATSNRNFYNNQLMLPPSVVAKAGDGDSGLVFHRVREGGYERGKTARNEIEAEEVAQAVLRHARTSPKLSLGIGTFSVAQRDAVRDRLEYLAAHNPDLDAFIRRGAREEAVFIKNLENIQGDERDVIFISIGYGRDQDGRLTQQFGPVGREGGERRLNVLITRARKRCEVFSSLVAEDIKSEGAPKPGVAALKEFLKLAKDGYADLPSETGRGFDSDFEESVALAIGELGYKVHPQVGIAGFFVDLGVLDPRNSDRYLLGVECDGAAYHSSIYARDRDRLRQHILETRGWRIHRIWSTDWFYRQDREVEKMKAALEAALESESLQTAEELYPVNPAPERREIEAAEPDSPIPFLDDAPAKLLEAYVLYSAFAPERKYAQPHELSPSRLAELVTDVIAIEQPIHEDEIARRLAAAFGLQRAGSRIQDATETGLQTARRSKKVASKGAFWCLADAKELAPRDRSELPAAHTARKPELICPTEIAQAARIVLAQSLALERDELVVETARALGFARTGQDVSTAINGAIKKKLASELEIDHLGRQRLKDQ